MTAQKCAVCERMIHEGDVIIAVVSSVFHSVPSDVLYAIEQPSECHKMAHEYCISGDEVELCQK